MNRKTNEKNEVLTIGELAEVSGIRQTTIKYYTEIGILPYQQEEKGLRRKYVKNKALKRLNLINDLKKVNRYSINEIKEYFNK